MGQTISYLHELPSIRYFSESSIIVGSVIGHCELAKDDSRQEGSGNIINPKSLTPRNSNNQHRGKRDTSPVGNILVIRFIDDYRPFNLTSMSSSIFLSINTESTPKTGFSPGIF